MNDEKLMMKEFRRTYPQLKNDADPLYHPALETFSHNWKVAFKAGEKQGIKDFKKILLKENDLDQAGHTVCSACHGAGVIGSPGIKCPVCSIFSTDKKA